MCKEEKKNENFKKEKLKEKIQELQSLLESKGKN